MIRDLLVLQRLNREMTKNTLVDWLRRRPFAMLFFSLFGGFFYWGYLKLAWLLLEFVFKQPVYGELLTGRLIQILLFISLGVALMSSLTTAIAHFYMSRDLEFQFGLPVDFKAWVLHRFSQVYLQSNWMLLAFGGPLIIMYLSLHEALWPIRILGLMVMMMVCTFPVALATLVCMVLIKFFPARRVHQVFLVVTVVLVSALIFLFRYIQPEQFIGPGGLEIFRGYVDLVNIETQQWNPAIWASNIVIGLGAEVGSQMLPDVLKLVLSFTLTLALLFLTARYLYRPSWDRALQSLSGEGEFRQEAKYNMFSEWLALPRRHQVGREVLLFLRDPSQWSQIFVLIALLGLYLFSLTKINANPFGGTLYGLALGNTGFVAFIALSVSSRFVFTAFSQDGQAVWIMKTTPDGWAGFMRAKLYVFGIPVLVFGLILSTASGLVLNLTAAQMSQMFLFALWDIGFLVFLSLGFGMMFINPGIENPLKLIVSPGGFLLMAVGLAACFFHVLMRLSYHSEIVNGLLGRVYWPNFQAAGAHWYFFAVIAAEVIALLLLIRHGLNHLRMGDYL